MYTHVHRCTCMYRHIHAYTHMQSYLYAKVHVEREFFMHERAPVDDIVFCDYHLLHAAFLLWLVDATPSREMES